MKDSLQRNILLLGLPETGKTSFLAAFYHTVSSELPDKKLYEYKLSKDNTYLNQIVTQWLRCEKLDRTASITGYSTREVTIHLTEKGSNQQIDLNIPDIAGESFETQFINLIWDNQYKDQVYNCSGMLLFINPSKIKPHALIDDVSIAIKTLVIDTNDSFEAVEFDVEKLPTQVVLVDIIQSHLEYSKAEVLNLAVVISAWDEIINSGLNISPSKWIEINLPLFYQYLVTNFENIAINIFGISAQGGLINDKESVEKLQEYSEPADRIIVREGDLLHNNICAPIEWIIKQWKKTDN